MSRPVSVLVLAALASAAAAQSTPDPTTWLRRTFPDFQRANVASAVAAAQAAGLLQTPQQYRAFKDAFWALREAKGTAGSGRTLLLDAPPAVVARRLEDAIVTEVEYNDGSEYATALGLDTVASGSCVAVNDVDVWTFFSPGEFVTAEVQAVGPTPITDSMLGIKTQDGEMLAFSEDISPTNYLSRTSVYLPIGFYQLEVGPWNSSGGGTYDVVLQRDPVTLAPLALGPNAGTTTVPGTGAQTVWQLTLASDATIDLRVTPGATADLQLIVQFADGRMWFLNDDSTINATNPAADLDMPAGSYTVSVINLLGPSVPYTLDYAMTPTVLPDLALGVPVSGSVLGKETRRLYRLTLGSAGAIDLQTAGGPTPIGDSILYVYDNDGDYLCDVDDADITNPANYYSRLRVGLPANAYFVGVRGYLATAGDYVLTPTVGLPFPATGTAGYGTNAMTVAGGGTVSLAALSVCSGNSVRLDSNGGLAASLYGFMDAAGNSLGVAEWSQDNARIGQGGRMRSRPTVGWLPRGTNWVLSWHRFEQATTTMQLSIEPSLGCELGQLVGRGRAGELALLFADFAAGPGVSLAAYGIDGWLCLPFGSPTLVTVGLAFYDTYGRIGWFACPTTPAGFYVQHGDLYAVPTAFVGSFRERRAL